MSDLDFLTLGNGENVERAAAYASSPHDIMVLRPRLQRLNGGAPSLAFSDARARETLAEAEPMGCDCVSGG